MNYCNAPLAASINVAHYKCTHYYYYYYCYWPFLQIANCTLEILLWWWWWWWWWWWLSVWKYSQCQALHSGESTGLTAVWCGFSSQWTNTNHWWHLGHPLVKIAPVIHKKCHITGGHLQGVPEKLSRIIIANSECISGSRQLHNILCDCPSFILTYIHDR